MPPNTPHPHTLATKSKRAEIQKAKQRESQAVVQSFLGLDPVATGIKATGFTQTEILEILSEIARDENANHSDKIRAITRFQQTVERAAELNGQIGKASAESRSEDEQGRLVRRVEVSKLIPPPEVREEDFVSFSSEMEPGADREVGDGSVPVDEEGDSGICDQPGS